MRIKANALPLRPDSQRIFASSHLRSDSWHSLRPLTNELSGQTPARRLAREEHDDSERLAGQVPSRLGVRSSEGLAIILVRWRVGDVLCIRLKVMGVHKPWTTNGYGLEVNAECQLPKEAYLDCGVGGIAFEHDAVERP